MACKLVSYLRVSTARQGASGLGLEGQQAAIAAHVKSTGCALIAEYIEVETGKRDSLDNRPELQKAIAHAKRSKATLVIAKLDRLARSVAVVSVLHSSGVEFVCCDNPTANRMTIQILAAVAENEARQISERTKAALAAYKARGGRLGGSRTECRNITPEGRKRGILAAAVVNTSKARDAYADLLPWLRNARNAGKSLRQIAGELNADGQTSRRDRQWTATQVKRVLDRTRGGNALKRTAKRASL